MLLCNTQEKPSKTQPKKARKPKKGLRPKEGRKPKKGLKPKERRSRSGAAPREIQPEKHRLMI